MNLYNHLNAEQEKKLETLIKENNTLSFQLDILSKKLSKAIKSKTEEEAEDDESRHLLFELSLKNSEIESLESEKKSFLFALNETSDLQSHINKLKSQIKILESKNQELRSIPSISTLYEELLMLKSKELQLRTSLKQQKKKIANCQNFGLDSEFYNDFEGFSATPDVLMQISKNRELKSEQKRVKQAWNLVLSEADLKKKELEEEIAELNLELKTRTSSCRKKKLESRKFRNFS
jgi:hypothetical protein